VPMPPHPTMKDEEIEKMVKYILSLKGGKAPAPVVKAASTEKLVVVDSKVADALKFMKEKSDCMACHKESEKLLGPSFVEIAQKYAGDKDAPKNLAGKVKNGGQGVWGQVPMLPHPSLTDDEISNLVSAILSYGAASSASPSASPASEFATTFDFMKTKSDCYVCHKDKEVSIAPAFLEISKKYKGIKDIKELVEKVKKGSTGVWGQTPMIPHPGLTDQEIENMIKAILSVQ
jgi:cytochrome c